jgi:WD40 repeat protein
MSAASTARGLAYGGGPTAFVDEQTLAYQCGNAVKLSNVATGSESFLGGAGYGISAVAASSGLVAYAEKGVAPTVSIFGFPKLKKPLTTLEGVAELDVDALALSRHGDYLVVASAGPDNSVAVYSGGPTWAAATKLCEATAKDGCLAVSVNPGDSSEICTISTAGGVTLRRVLPGAEAYTLESWCPLPDALASEEAVSHGWSANHRLVIGFASGAAVSLDLEGLDVGAAAPVSTLCTAQEPANAATAVSSTATRVVVGFADGTLSWVDDTGSSETVTKPVAEGAIVCICLGSGGALWVGAESGSLSCVTLRDAAEGDAEADGQVADVEVAFSHNSEPLIALGGLTWEGASCLVSCSPAGVVSTWGADKLGSIDTGAEAASMAVTSATGLVAVGSTTGVIRLIDAANFATPQTVYRSKVHQGSVTHVAFSPDGSLIASAGEDKRVFFTDANGSKGFASIGYVPMDAAITSFVWREGTPDDGDDSDGLRLVICTADGVLTQVTPPDMDYSSPADLKMSDKDVDKRAWRLREPLVQMAISSSATGFLYGFTAKGPGAKYTRRFDMRATSLTPMGEKPRLLKVEPLSDIGHVKGGSCLAFSGDGSVLVTGGKDGAIVVRNMDATGEGSVVATLRRHDGAGVNSDGVTCIAMGGPGVVYSGGFDGALFELAVKGASAPTAFGSRSEFLAGVEAVDEAAAESADDQDDVIALSIASARAAIAAAAAAGGDTAALKDSLKSLRDRFQQALKNNDVVPELEQMERWEFEIDKATVAAKKAEADAEAEALRQRIRSENVVKDMIAGRIKVDCYDVMQVQKATMTAYDTGKEVPNFPLKKQSDEELAELETIKALRSAEVEEMKWLEQNEPSESNALADPSDAKAKAAAAAAEAEGDEEEGDGEEGEEEGSEDGGSGSARAELEDLLYAPEDLTSSRRKRVQITLLDAKVRILRMEFNAVWDDHMLKKDASISEIMGKRNRCQEIIDELGTLGEGLELPDAVALSASEQAEKVLTVDDAEITAEKWISPEQQKILDEEAAEAARREAEKGNSPFDRALIEMMGGSLNANENQMRLDEVIEKPEWMLETPEEDLSDEQKAEIVQFEEAAVAREEQVVKEVNVLKTEMRKTVGEILELREKWDKTMAALFTTWMDASNEIFQVELWRVRLSSSVLQAEELTVQEATIRADMKAKTMHKSVTTQAAKAYYRQVDACQVRENPPHSAVCCAGILSF